MLFQHPLETPTKLDRPNIRPDLEIVSKSMATHPGTGTPSHLVVTWHSSHTAWAGFRFSCSQTRRPFTPYEWQGDGGTCCMDTVPQRNGPNVECLFYGFQIKLLSLAAA